MLSMNMMQSSAILFETIKQLKSNIYSFQTNVNKEGFSTFI